MEEHANVADIAITAAITAQTVIDSDTVINSDAGTTAGATADTTADIVINTRTAACTVGRRSTPPGHELEAHLSHFTRCGARHSGRCATEPKSVQVSKPAPSPSR